MTLDEARERIGKRVIYWPHGLLKRSDSGMPTTVAETGTIGAVNDSYVFVVYDGDTHAKATKPEDLTLEV